MSSLPARLAALTATAAIALAACGQKGPLYLPDRSGTVITKPAPASAPVTAPTTSQPGPAPTPVAPDKDKQQTPPQ
ncbi:MAG TPA: lipoprotein [Steroidobacteraceae bacterium]